MMFRLFAIALCLASGFAVSARAQDQAAATAATDAAARYRITVAIAASGFAGTYAVHAGPRRIAGGSVGTAVDGQAGGFEPGAAWPWASVTKQVMAVIAMQEVERGRLRLDLPVRRYLPGFRGTATVRQLIEHRAGLRNPEASVPDADGFPSFYTTGPGGPDWCMTGVGAAGGTASYNNCDYIVLGALLERTTRTPLPQLFALRIAEPLGLSAGFIDPDIDPDATAPDARWPGGPTSGEQRAIARFGAAGALVGTAADLATFDRALLSDTLLSAAARDRMWRGDPRSGGVAPGQRSFVALLTGCAAPMRVVEARGGIGRFAVRNVILPASGLSVVLFSNRGNDVFGEVEQGTGVTHAVLSAAACG